MLRPPHPLDNGGKDSDPSYRAQLYEVRVRDWHWRINHTVLSLSLFCLVLIWALSPAGLPMLGGIAWANSTDQKIQSVVQPLQMKVDEIARQTKQIKEQQDTKELADLRQKLFETRVAQCKARTKGSSSDNPYSERMRELQELHFNLTRAYYQPSLCDDL